MPSSARTIIRSTLLVMVPLLSVLFVSGVTLARPSQLMLALDAAAPTGDRPRIAAFVSPHGGPSPARLRAELNAAGFELRLASPPRWPPTREDIAAVARGEAAVAGLALVPRQNGTEIWLVDRVTGKTVIRELVFAAVGAREEADLIAICAVETLRATLMEVTLPHPSRGEIAAPASLHALVESDRDQAEGTGRLIVRLATAIGYGPGAIGASGHVGIAVTASPWQRVRLGIDGFVPLTEPTVSAVEGRAQVGLYLAGLLVEGWLREPAARLNLILGVGAWLAISRLRGSAVPPYQDTSLYLMTAAPHLDIAARVRLGRRLAFGARLSTAFATPSAAILFAGSEVARWGRPWFLGAALMEVVLD